MISNNNTNLNLSYYPPNLCLLLLPRSLMLLPPPHSLPPLPIHMHSSTFNCHTQTHISSDSTGRPGQTRRFLAVIWIETVLVHFLEWPAENERWCHETERTLCKWFEISLWNFEQLFIRRYGESETVHKCREMKKDKEVKTLQNGGKQELQSCTDRVFLLE